MPELVELVASYLVACHWYKAVKDCSLVLHLSAIWADATKQESPKLPEICPGHHGHVYKLDHSCNIKRGPNFSQQPVYPPVDKPIEHLNLEIQDIEFNPRNIIFAFHQPLEKEAFLWLQVQMLTHTVLQVFDRSQWDNSICRVTSKNRGFRVGMALDFGEYIIAFLTLDNLFAAHWKPTRAQLPAQHPDILMNFPAFLERVVRWLRERGSGRKLGFAFVAIRSQGEVFGGIGVYTVLELFFRAGISPFLTEDEVVDVPSRFSRLLMAELTHNINAHNKIWDFIRPFLHQGFMLAVQNKDRLRYASLLKVYGKSMTEMPVRMRALRDAYVNVLNMFAGQESIWTRDAAPALYDVFEPSFIQPALTHSQNLGHMIYGDCDRWTALGGTPGWQGNPLEVYYEEQGIVWKNPAITFLDPHFSGPLFLSEYELSRSSAPTFLYHAPTKSVKPIWSIVPAFPINSRPTVALRDSKLLQSTIITHIADKKRHTFQYLVQNSKEYIVGPLDYCGVGHVIKRNGRSKELIIMVCFQDPEVQPYYAHREEEASAERRVSDKPGKRKGSVVTTKQKQWRREDVAAAGMGSDRNRVVLGELRLLGNTEERPAKKARMSIDKRIEKGLTFY